MLYAGGVAFRSLARARSCFPFACISRARVQARDTAPELADNALT